MTADNASAANEDLQFDRVVSDSPAGEEKARPSAACVACKKPIEGEYFHLNGKVTCASCRSAIAEAVSTPKGLGPLGRSAGLGVLAAIAGAFQAVLLEAHGRGCRWRRCARRASSVRDALA